MDFNLIGFDYTNLLHKKIAVDPATKALLTKEIGNAYVLKTGDTMTGLLILSGDPTQALGAATKQYVDSKAGLTGVTDASKYDTLQDAIDAAISSGNKFVWIPKGTYEISSPLSFPADGFSFIGAGQKVVIIKATATMDALIKQVAKRHLTIGGFRLDGNANKASRGIWLEDSVWFSKFFDIDIRDIDVCGLYLTHSSDTEVGTCPYWNLFENIQCGRISDRGTHGIILEGDVNLNTFINVTAAADENALYLKNFDFGGAIGVKAPQQNIFIAYDAGGSTATTKGVRIDDHAYSNMFITPFVEGCNRSMDIQHQSNLLIGGLFNGNTYDEPLAPSGIKAYSYQIGADLYGSWFGTGVTKLSDLEIDADKDWATRNITNIGTVEHKGATLKSGIQTEGRCTAYERDASVDYPVDDMVESQVPFREKMTNTPSSITLSDAAETENAWVKSVSAVYITVFGFVFLVYSAGGKDTFASISKKYVTVGN